MTSNSNLWLLDLDNTLYSQHIFDKAVITASVNKYNLTNGCRSIDSVLRSRLIAARRTDRRSPLLFSQILINSLFSEVDIIQFLSIYRDISSCHDIELPLYGGCEEALRFLCHHGDRLVIATNGRKKTQANKLRCLPELRNFIDHVIILDNEHGRSLKPSPAFIVSHLQGFGINIKSAHTFVVGDDLECDKGLASSIGCRYYHPSQLWNTS